MSQEEQKDSIPTQTFTRGGGGKGRGKSRGRGRGGGRGGSNATDQQPKPKQIPDGISLDDALKPKALGGKPTPPKNDSIYDSSILIEGVNGFVEEKMNSNFELDYSQFSTLIETSYQAQTTTDRGGAKFISLSMFKYYCTLAFWKRVAQIESGNIGSPDYDELHKALGEMAIPDDIRTYLDGLGNITDNESQTWRLHFPQKPSNAVVLGGAAGSFNQIDDNTHILYETLPAPIIPLLNICADMEKTMNNGPTHWDLPAALTPANHGQIAPGLPTANLVTYGQAQKLTDDQINVLENHGFISTPGQEDFGTINICNIPINQSLVAYINNQLKNSKSPCQPYMTTSTNGTLAQIPFTVRAPSDTDPQRNRSAVSKLGMTKSYRQNTAYIASAAATFRYRFKRKINNQTTDCYCYFFPNPQNNNVPTIPPNWIANENRIFDAPVKWNIRQFGLSSQDGRGLLDAYSCRTKKKIA